MDEGVDPKNMCQQMVKVIDEHAELESLANPEIRTLFIDWMEELEEEVLGYYDKTQESIPEGFFESFFENVFVDGKIAHDFKPYA